MNWFKIQVNNGSEKGQTHVGASADSLESLLQKARGGEYIRLDDMRYRDQRGITKPWEEWDASLIPSVVINPDCILNIMQFKGDPLTTPSQAKGKHAYAFRYYRRPEHRPRDPDHRLRRSTSSFPSTSCRRSTTPSRSAADTRASR